MVCSLFRNVCCLVSAACYMLCGVRCVRCRVWFVAKCVLLCGCVLFAV